MKKQMKIEKIKSIEFFNRESEKEEILNILRAEPRLITFIYGPINSGKTSLITNLIENLPDDHAVIYINLRERIISTYKDFVEAIFDVKHEGLLSKIIRKLKKQQDIIYDATSTLGKTHGIPIPKSVFDGIFREEKPKDAFVYILNIIKDIKSKGKTPIFIIDELQKIGDVKVDNYLIYDVFNFFIRLTKELHLCHVFALSSDSLFIERVYGEAVLQERCEYLLIDDFDSATAKKFLEKYGFNNEEQQIALNYFGGKPIHLTGIIDVKARGGDIKKKFRKNIKKRKGEIRQKLYYIKNIGKDITFGEATIKLSHNRIIEVMKIFKNNEIMEYKAITPEIAYLTSENVIFVDPMNTIIKPQSKIDLTAIREVLEELET